MNIEKAQEIRDYKRGCTYRALSVKFNGTDDQMDGMDLCREALKVLYPNDEVWGMPYPGVKFGEKFNEENVSHFAMESYREWLKNSGDYRNWHDYNIAYWWE